MKNLNKEQKRALKWLLSKGMSITRSKKNYKIFDDLLNELEPSSITAVSCQRELLINCLKEWECSDNPEDIKAFEIWLDARPQLINYN